MQRPAMSLPSSLLQRRADPPARDKPQIERAEHANLDRRPGARLRPGLTRSARPIAPWGRPLAPCDPVGRALQK